MTVTRIMERGRQLFAMSDSDVSVSLEDEFHKYDIGYEVNGPSPGERTGQNMEVSLEDKAREAASILLQKDSPTVIVNYQGTKFLLFNCNHSLDELSPIICDNANMIHQNCIELMKVVRVFFEKYYGHLVFMTKEIMFEIPCLDLTLSEDNLFNDKITFNDIETIFNILKERSQSRGEFSVPNYIEISVSLRPRFVSRYNYLVELTESDATFSNIQPYSNNETNPLVLDDEVTRPVEITDGDTNLIVISNDEDEIITE